MRGFRAIPRSLVCKHVAIGRAWSHAAHPRDSPTASQTTRLDSSCPGLLRRPPLWGFAYGARLRVILLSRWVHLEDYRQRPRRLKNVGARWRRECHAGTRLLRATSSGWFKGLTPARILVSSPARSASFWLMSMKPRLRVRQRLSLQMFCSFQSDLGSSLSLCPPFDPGGRVVLHQLKEHIEAARRRIRCSRVVRVYQGALKRV